jgi:protein phosphatase 1 regulatory subunit 32
MGKLPLGTPNPHIKKSNGADTDIMKFYCTQYSSTYGKKFSKFQPRQGKHTGTGYLSNFRPAVHYTEKLDEIDNPAMG